MRPQAMRDHCGSDGKECACSAGYLGSIRGSGRSPGEGNGHPLQYSCLENSLDREVWQATVHEIAKNQTQLRPFSFLIQFYLWFDRLFFPIHGII